LFSFYDECRKYQRFMRKNSGSPFLKLDSFLLVHRYMGASLLFSRSVQREALEEKLKWTTSGPQSYKPTIMSHSAQGSLVP
jgi:hypothetical protein